LCDRGVGCVGGAVGVLVECEWGGGVGGSEVKSLLF